MNRDMLLEIDEHEGVTVGRDIRKMTPAEIENAGLERVSRGDAIRAKCLDCVYSSTEVKKCVSVTCALWPFRFGTDPFREKRDMSDEQRDAARVRFQNARLAQKSQSA